VWQKEHVKSKGEKTGRGKMRKHEDDAEFVEITSIIVFHFLLLFSLFSYF
jgi:hypothetical protein